MKRILFVLDELFPVRGAPQVRIRNLFEALPGWERYAVGGRLGEGAAPEGYMVIERPSERQPLAFILFLRRLGAMARRVARRVRPDVVVVSVPKYELLSAAPGFKASGRTLVLDFRDSLAFLDYGAYLGHFVPRWVAEPLGWIISGVNRWLQRRAMRSADLITVANEGIKATIDHPRVVVVPNGVDTDLFRADDKRWFDGSRPLRLVYLGNFAEKDRFEWLAALAGRSDIEVHLIGQGRNRDRVVAALSGVKTVVHGVVPHDELPGLLKEMDLGFIFRDEGVDQSIPVCLFEFTAMDIPAICNATGIMAQFVRDNGIGYVVGDAAEAARVVGEVADQPRELERFRGLHGVAERCFSLRASREIFQRTIASESEPVSKVGNGA
jgi:glycosyltransferase involved in cell wall biosynthesis